MKNRYNDNLPILLYALLHPLPPRARTNGDGMGESKARPARDCCVADDEVLGSPVIEEVGSPVIEEGGSPVIEELGSPVIEEVNSPVVFEAGSSTAVVSEAVSEVTSMPSEAPLVVMIVASTARSDWTAVPSSKSPIDGLPRGGIEASETTVVLRDALV